MERYVAADIAQRFIVYPQGRSRTPGLRRRQWPERRGAEAIGGRLQANVRRRLGRQDTELIRNSSLTPVFRVMLRNSTLCSGMNRNLTLHAQIGVTEHEVVKGGKEEEDPVASRDYFRCQALSFFRRAYKIRHYRIVPNMNKIFHRGAMKDIG